MGAIGWRAVLALLFVLALGWRLFALSRLAGSPLLGNLEADSEIYWRWAGSIHASGWIGHNPFFLSPLYAYALALVRSLTGDSVIAVLRVQAVLGASAVVLLADASRRLTTSAWGLVIGLAASFYAIGTFFDLLILSESLLYFLEALLVWMVVAWPWRERWLSGSALVGCLIGLLAQGRPTAPVLLLAFAMLLASQLSHQAPLGIPC